MLVRDTGDDQESYELPEDDQCFSPYPVSTLNPFTEFEVGGRGYFPGILGKSLTYVLPLEKPLPRIFDKLSQFGWDKRISKDIWQRRTNLFFNVFLEDCRYKHQFEGFLIEPFFTDEVEYLICSIPFGMEFQAENSVIAKGCPHIRQSCENMKKCYVRHAEYFGFHSFFNHNIFYLAIWIMVVFAVSVITAIIMQHLYPVKVFKMQFWVESFVQFCLGITGGTMLAFYITNSSSIDIEAELVELNVYVMPSLRLLWHLGSHLYTVVFTFRSVCC